MNYGDGSIEIRKEKNLIKVCSNVDIVSREDLSTYYTPGVAEVSRLIARDSSKVFDLTMKKNSVAIITDGSAVLGLGNIGPEAALPVMEGKALLFAEFAGIDAFPICLATQNTDEIIRTIRNIAPGFGGINLEDISAPRCFEIEKALQDLGIPVMHDDQHATAVVVLAGLINALKVVNKKIENVKIIVSGAGAAGTAIAKIILKYSKKKAKVIVLDSQGAICLSESRFTKQKAELAQITENQLCSKLEAVIKGADVFIGVSKPNVLSFEMVKTMNKEAIVFAMANPDPEIDPSVALEAGASIVATGRSDFPNQINNVLVFPGIFRGALDARAKQITEEMKFAACMALVNYTKNLSPTNIIPSPLDKGVVLAVSDAVKRANKLISGE